MSSSEERPVRINCADPTRPSRGKNSHLPPIMSPAQDGYYAASGAADADRPVFGDRSAAFYCAPRPDK